MASRNEPVLEQLLHKAVELDASDLHLVAGEPPVFRVQGSLQRSEQDPLTADDIQRIVEFFRWMHTFLDGDRNNKITSHFTNFINRQVVCQTTVHKTHILPYNR